MGDNKRGDREGETETERDRGKERERDKKKRGGKIKQPKSKIKLELVVTPLEHLPSLGLFRGFLNQRLGRLELPDKRGTEKAR